MRARASWPVILAIIAVACSTSQRSTGQAGAGSGVAARSIDEVLAQYTDSLMALPGVVGTAVSQCDRNSASVLSR
jgi:hypothetical protein